MPKRREQVDMSVFRDAVEDCLDYKPEPPKGSGNINRSSAAAEPDVEKFSGLRIRWLRRLHVLLDFSSSCLYVPSFWTFSCSDNRLCCRIYLVISPFGSSFGLCIGYLLLYSGDISKFSTAMLNGYFTFYISHSGKVSVLQIAKTWISTLCSL